MSVDGTTYDSTSCKWFAYQAVRSTRTPDLEIMTTNRLVMEDSAILWRVKLTNTSATKKTIRVSIDTDGVRRDAMGGVQLIARSQEFAMNAIYQFFDSPINGTDDARVEWELSLDPEQYREIRFFMKAGMDDETQLLRPYRGLNRNGFAQRRCGRAAGTMPLHLETSFFPVTRPLCSQRMLRSGKFTIEAC